MSRLTLADIARKGCVAVVSGSKCGVVDDLQLSLLLGNALAQSNSLRWVKIGAHPRTLPSLSKLQGSETVGVLPCDR